MEPFGSHHQQHAGASLAPRNLGRGRGQKSRGHRTPRALLFLPLCCFAGALSVMRSLRIGSPGDVGASNRGDGGDAALPARRTEPSRDDYASCLEEALRGLPVGPGPQHKRKRMNLLKSDQLLVWAHHFDARNDDKWNPDIRFERMPELDGAADRPCSVWEVGAHTQAEDTRVLRETYSKCEYHAYEPIPSYYAQLSKHWQSSSNVHTHNYGLGREDGEFLVPQALLKGQSTYIGDAKRDQKAVEAKDAVSAAIKSFEHAVQDAGGIKPTLLHMNCEGCEWKLLPGAMESGFVKDVPIIQIGFHNYGQSLGGRAIEYCKIRMRLRETHDLVDGAVPFAWERWVLKREKN